mmetsp:Transcript_5068/g.6995  ORF Transcript_5068/g.6995 Transcript_5068/m.6995 type:complete len:147 (-) Transcript_5068:185-625(-)
MDFLIFDRTMISQIRSLVAIFTLICAAIVTLLDLTEGKEYFVCEAGDEMFLGKFVQDGGEKDASPTFTNENGMSIWRNQGFWYMGNLEPWPPETHYRCVMDCPRNADDPPLQGYKRTKQHGIDPSPVLQESSCTLFDEEEEVKDEL